MKTCQANACKLSITTHHCVKVLRSEFKWIPSTFRDTSGTKTFSMKPHSLNVLCHRKVILQSINKDSWQMNTQYTDWPAIYRLKRSWKCSWGGRVTLSSSSTCCLCIHFMIWWDCLFVEHPTNNFLSKFCLCQHINVEKYSTVIYLGCVNIKFTSTHRSVKLTYVRGCVIFHKHNLCVSPNCNCGSLRDILISWLRKLKTYPIYSSLRSALDIPIIFNN